MRYKLLAGPLVSTTINFAMKIRKCNRCGNTFSPARSHHKYCDTCHKDTMPEGWTHRAERRNAPSRHYGGISRLRTELIIKFYGIYGDKRVPMPHLAKNLNLEGEAHGHNRLRWALRQLRAPEKRKELEQLAVKAAKRALS